MGRDVSLSRAFRKSRRFKNVTEALGERVREMRKGKGWTLEKASAKIGIDFRHLQQIEAGTVNVTLATILRLCDAFGVSPFVLLPHAKETKSKLGAPRPVRHVLAVWATDSGPRHPGQVMENPTEPLPPAELADAKKRVGSAIKRLRQDKGLTQRRLAESMKTSVQHVQSIEGGKENMTIESMLKFANALGVDPGKFW